MVCDRKNFRYHAVQAYRKQYGLDLHLGDADKSLRFWDNFDLQSSHVIAALLAKAHAIKVKGSGELVVWGSGTPRREFLYADDLADALVFLMQYYSGEEHINVGVGRDMTIRELAELVVRTVGIKSALFL
jgi:GDP-L-fucose synthase